MVCSGNNSSSSRTNADPGFHWAPSTEPASPGWVPARTGSSTSTANASMSIVDLWDTNGPAYGQNNSLDCSQANQTGWVCLSHVPPFQAYPLCSFAFHFRISFFYLCRCKYEDELFAERVLQIIAAQVGGLRACRCLILQPALSSYCRS